MPNKYVNVPLREELFNICWGTGEEFSKKTFSTTREATIEIIIIKIQYMHFYRIIFLSNGELVFQVENIVYSLTRYLVLSVTYTCSKQVYPLLNHFEWFQGMQKKKRKRKTRKILGISGYAYNA